MNSKKLFYNVTALILISLTTFLSFGCGEKTIDEVTQEGALVIPDFKFTASDNITYTEKDIAKGVSVISLMVSWCTPCVGELEALNQIQNEFVGKLRVFVFSFEEPSKFESLTAGLDLNYPIVQTDSAFFGKLNIDAIPTRILLKDGREVMRISGAPSFENEEFRSRIKQILGISNAD